MTLTLVKPDESSYEAIAGTDEDIALDILNRLEKVLSQEGKKLLKKQRNLYATHVDSVLSLGDWQGDAIPILAESGDLQQEIQKFYQARQDIPIVRTFIS